VTVSLRERLPLNIRPSGHRENGGVCSDQRSARPLLATQREPAARGTEGPLPVPIRANDLPGSAGEGTA